MRTTLSSIKFLLTIIALFLSVYVNSQVNFASNMVNGSVQASALGSSNNASGGQSLAIGYKSGAYGSQSLAAGHWSYTGGLASFALGARATATSDHAMAFGIDVQATNTRSITIGTGVGNGTSLVNNIYNSLMIGFNSTIPTVYVSTSAGAGTIGKVGIGTINTPESIGGVNISNYTLFVKGGVLADEVRVRTGWADYVFYDDYQLKPLNELENFIKINKHLPNIPSSDQIEKEGISVGDISRLQLEKIEELTLYIIEQDKEIQLQRQELERLKEVVKSIQTSKN